MQYTDLSNHEMSSYIDSTLTLIFKWAWSFSTYFCFSSTWMRLSINGSTFCCACGLDIKSLVAEPPADESVMDFNEFNSVTDHLISYQSWLW